MGSIPTGGSISPGSACLPGLSCSLRVDSEAQLWVLAHPPSSLCAPCMRCRRRLSGVAVSLKYRHQGGCVRGSWARRGMIFSTSWDGGVSFPVVVTLLAERILDPHLSVLWKVLRCGSVDLRIPPVSRGGELDGCGLYGRALWGSPMETSALSQFSSLPEGCLEGVLR